MAKDKRRPMSTDMNDIDLHDIDALTAPEQQMLLMGPTQPSLQAERKKKAM